MEAAAVPFSKKKKEDKPHKNIATNFPESTTNLQRCLSGLQG
jgi:hypothetical protein